MINGPHLVFDFNYESEMTDAELKNLCNQIMLCHGSNKVVREPFHFHFCNVRAGSKTEAKLTQVLGNVTTWPITITSGDYTDCYPRER